MGYGWAGDHHHVPLVLGLLALFALENWCTFSSTSLYQAASPWRLGVACGILII